VGSVLKSPAITVATFASLSSMRSPFQRCRNNNARTILGRLLVAQKDDHWARFNMFTEYVVSGSCADLIKVAMVKVASLLPEDVRMVATVHDELVFEAPIETAGFCRALVEEKMREAFVEMFGDTVPVEVGAKVCSNWGEKIVGPDLGAWHRAQLSRHGLHCRKRFAKFAAQVSTHFFMLSYDSGRQTPGAASSTAKPSIARLRA
jgi:DNA polymerase family A